MLSHGFLTGCINISEISRIRSIYKKLINLTRTENVYIENLRDHVPDSVQLINETVLKKVKELLDDQEPILCSVELHSQMPRCQAIPPHQDNFYHCVENNKGLKVLIPLTKMCADSGGLFYCDINTSYPIIEHRPSNIKNFSSYIKEAKFKELKLKATSYHYELGDASYHFLNSIHYSIGNQSNYETTFVVFRYQSKGAKINSKALQKYKECYKEHMELISSK